MSIDRQKTIEAAQKFAAKGLLDRAIAEYQRILQADPNDVRILLKIGDLQVRMNARAAAVETYSRVATSYDQQGFFLKSVAVYKQILQIDPGMLQLHARLADLYVKLNLPADAVQQLDALAQHYQRAESWDHLLALYRQMVQIAPENVATRIRHAELLSRLGRAEDAAREFEASCALLQRARRPDDWARVAERLFFHRQEDPALARDLASYYLDRDDAKHALPKLQVAYKANTRDIATLELLGRAFRSLGQLPKTVSVLKEVARLHGDAGRVKERNEAYQRVLELSATDAEARDALRNSSRVGRRPASVPPGPGPNGQAPSRVKPSAAPGPPLPAAARETDDADDVMIVEADEDVVFDLKPSVPSAAPPPKVQAPAPLEAQAPSQTPSRRAQSTPPASRRPPRPTAPVLPVSNRVVPRPLEKGPSVEAARLLNEAEIFLKYGLKPKAAANLVRAAELEPASLELHVRLRDLFASMNDGAGVLRECVTLARLLASRDVDAAMAEALRALELDPGHPEARALYDRLRGADGAEETLIDDEEVVLASAPLTASPHDDPYDLETGRGARAHYREEIAYPEEPLPYNEDEEDFTARNQRVEEVPFLDEPEGELPGEDVEALDVGAAETGPTSVPGVREIEAGLDEAEFFVTQGLYEDARETLAQLLELYPNHPLVLDRWGEVEQLLQMQAEGGEGRGVAEDGSFALAEKLAEEVDGLLPADRGDGDQFDVDTVFAQFKQELGRSVSVEDCDTHYDLGIAYKEMGLFDDAIAEFKIATMNVARQCIGETMIGLCYLEKGDPGAAVEHFKRGLQAPQRTEREELGLYFEIGAAYEVQGDANEALYFYQKVHKRDASFRSVSFIVQRLQALLAGTPYAPPDHDDVDRAFDDLLKE